MSCSRSPSWVGLLLLLAQAPAAGGVAPQPAAPARNDSVEAPVPRPFVIRHKDLDDVVTLIRPVLSEEATVLIQPKIRTLTVTDRPSNLAAAEALITGFDQPPHGVSINVNLVRASKGEPGPRARALPDRVPPNLQELTRWMDYELLGGMSILTSEEERSSLMLGEEYRIRFEVDQVDDRAGKIRLRDFSLERRALDRSGRESYVPIFDTVVSLRSGTPYVFGATRGQDAQRALFLTITASITP